MILKNIFTIKDVYTKLLNSYKDSKNSIEAKTMLMKKIIKKKIVIIILKEKIKTYAYFSGRFLQKKEEEDKNSESAQIQNNIDNNLKENQNCNDKNHTPNNILNNNEIIKIDKNIITKNKDIMIRMKKIKTKKLILI